MGKAFNIKIDDNDLRVVRSMLSDIPGAADRVMIRSINKTLTGVNTDAADELCKVLNVTEKGVKKTFAISNAKDGDISGFFASTGNPLSLIDLIGTRQTNKGVSVQVRKDHARKIIPGAFITTVKNIVKDTGQESNHEGVFWRKYHAGGKQTTKFEVRANRAGYVWSEKRNRFIPIAFLSKAFRLPIEQLFTGRIPDYLDDGPILDRVMSQAGQRLKDNLDHETDYELMKWKGEV